MLSAYVEIVLDNSDGRIQVHLPTDGDIGLSGGRGVGVGGGGS